LSKRAFRVWVSIPGDVARSGYLAGSAYAHHPASAQTVPWTSSAQVFPSLDDAHDAIQARGWEESTSVVPGRVTAFAVVAE
jgi:hypothetical protein